MRIDEPPALEDVLADVLATTRMGGGLWGRLELRKPWGVRFEPARKVAFHLVDRGTCFLTVQGERPVQLVPHDVVFIPHGSGHSIASGPGARLRPLSHFAEQTNESTSATNAESDITGLTCGVYHFDDDGPHPVLALLPRQLIVRSRDVEVGSSIDTVVQMLQQELRSREPGVRTVITRLLDVLLVQVVRRWARQQPEGAAGWIGALRDARIGAVLAAMHQSPARTWKVSDLARIGGVSPATLKRRFSLLVGEPPLAYLTRLRIEEAARQLRASERSLAEIASAVGYESEHALGRAFKRSRGMAPGQYRAGSRSIAS